jgi:hypothetical protein
VSSLAHGVTLPVIRPSLPTWRIAVTAVLMGWFFAWFAVVALALAASQLGLLERPQGGGPPDWPYPEAGLASLAANAIVWVWIIALTALLIRGLLADRTHRRVSALPIFVVLALTGFAPFLPRGLFDLPWPISLLATVALVRLVPRCSPAIPARATAVLILVASLLLLLPVLHAVRHPLWLGSDVIFGPPQRGTATISLRNSGFAQIELEAVSLQPRKSLALPRGVVEVMDVWVHSRPSFDPSRLFESGQLPFIIEGRSKAFVQLQFKPLGCGNAPLPSDVLVHYRVLGHGRMESFPTSIELRRCSSR